MTQIVWIVIRVLALGAALVLLPLGAGYIFFHRGEFDRGFVYLFGMCAVLAGFELVYIPFFLLGLSFTLMTAVFFVLALAAALWGFQLKGAAKCVIPREKKPLSRAEKLCSGVFAIVALWQVARTTLGGGTWNIDDAWYLGLANTVMYTDEIFRTDPVTGLAYNFAQHISEYLTYVFSPWPIFWAMFARMFSFEITVLMRTVLPGFFIALFYYVMYRLAAFFFRGDRAKSLFALALLSVFFEICGVAMNVKFTWVICYPWMGKAFGPSIVCPLALYFFLLTQEEGEAKKRRALWLGVFLANAAGCMVASSSAEMCLMYLGCWGLVYVIKTRDLSAIWKLACAAAPSFALMAGHFVV